MSESHKIENPDPIELLTQDHQRVIELFTQFEQTPQAGARQRIISETIAAVAVHAAIEEQIFYPAARALVDDKNLIDLAIAEHGEAQRMMDNLAETSDTSVRDEKFGALAELVKKHIVKEEGELFPECIKKRARFGDLGTRLQEQRAELNRVRLFL